VACFLNTSTEIKLESTGQHLMEISGDHQFVISRFRDRETEPHAEQGLKTACGPAPAGACKVLLATTSWWRILLDPNDTRHDREFTTRADDAIEECTRWADSEPQRAEAWFYLGAAYGARVSFRVQRGERLAAARDGKRIKEALERAYSLDPQLDDARFGVGLYKYYADIAPAAAKMLRFLLMLPGGDRVEGLKDMEAVRRGVLLRGEADYQLHWICNGENEPKRAWPSASLRSGIRQPHSRPAHGRASTTPTSTTRGPRWPTGRPWSTRRRRWATRAGGRRGPTRRGLGARRASRRPTARSPGSSTSWRPRPRGQAGARAQAETLQSGSSSIDWDGEAKPSPHTVPPLRAAA
jgi:hypothetical protein